MSEERKNTDTFTLVSGPAEPLTAPRSFLFEDELLARYRGYLSASALEKWRKDGCGPPFAYLGRRPIYPLTLLQVWEDSLPTSVLAAEHTTRRRVEKARRTARGKKTGRAPMLD